MPKKCNICNDTATFSVKDTSDFYCKQCAEESFGDLTLLMAIEEQAKDLKRMIDDKIEGVGDQRADDPEDTS